MRHIHALFAVPNIREFLQGAGEESMAPTESYDE
jgi:hypothetical protein